MSGCNSATRLTMGMEITGFPDLNAPAPVACSVIAMIDVPYGERELEDCIRTIGRASQDREYERLTEELKRASREGDQARVLQLGIEIIALEKQRKMS